MGAHQSQLLHCPSQWGAMGQLSLSALSLQEWPLTPLGTCVRGDVRQGWPWLYVQPDTRIANWRWTCQQGDFIWGVSLGSLLPFLFWMPFEQLSVQVFVITQALLLQPFVFGGVTHCLDLLSLVICAKKFVRSLHMAGACAHCGAGVGWPWVCCSVITHWLCVDRDRVNLGLVGAVVVTGVVFQNGWAESLQLLNLFSRASRPWIMCNWWPMQG